MNFIDKQNIPRVQVGEDGGQIPRPLDGGARGDADILAHFRRHDAGQGGLAQARRAVEQNVIQRVVALEGGVDINAQAVFHLVLADIFPQMMRPQGGVNFFILGPHAAHDQTIVHKRPSFFLI